MHCCDAEPYRKNLNIVLSQSELLLGLVNDIMDAATSAKKGALCGSCATESRNSVMRELAFLLTFVDKNAMSS